jgi:nucleotide-binding universal stress UspA family protein
VSAVPRFLPRAPDAVLEPHVRPLRSILAIADFSPKSDNAVTRAALLAREHGARLHLLHVVAPRMFAAASLWPARDDTPLRIERAGRALATLAARTAKAHGIQASCKVRAGDALHVILEESGDADLVVVAAKKRNPLSDVVLKTPTERLLRMLQRPMLVVKRPAHARYAGVLLPAAASSRAGYHDAPTSAARYPGAGDELVVVPKGGHASLGKFLLGSLAQRLVAHASCDVLVLPDEAGAGEHDPAPARAGDAVIALRRRQRTRPKPAS